MKKVVMLISIFIILFSGCAGKVSPAGKKTREIDMSWKNSCIYIGSNETSSAMKFGAKGNYAQVRNNIKNGTAKMGGNSYMVNDFINDGMGHFSATFEVYKCPETKYNVPKRFEALDKLKELFDKGVIDEEEYKAEKAKVLNAHR